MIKGSGMNEGVIFLGVLILLVGSASGLFWIKQVQRRKALIQWAAYNDYQLVSFEAAALDEATPFPFKISKAQEIFHVSILQKDGRAKSGWLLLGGDWFGLDPADAEVKWDT